MFKRTLTIALTAGAVLLFGGVVIAGARSVDNKPAPAFVPASVTDSTIAAPATTGATVATTPATVPTSRPPATTATSVPAGQPRATTVSTVPTSTPTSQPRTTVTSVSTSVPGSTTVVTIDDHGGDRPRDDRSGSGSGRSGGSDDD
jgi:hypothetical protein